ncbi:type II toxin-antitoxin system HigB family toxin [Candidatus Amarolinea aalborgensis]|uniref:type II toxin-antitoxin system HigB family toxin n=1 Tax=Candidatus Amarolinea aalborgensis TaxID=2249329 RepID=UPI003BF99EF6
MSNQSDIAPYLILRYTRAMHIISRKTLREFWERYPDSEGPLLRWYKIIERSEYSSFTALRATFPSADLVGDLVVFNIGGNKYRLIASVHFNRGKVYVRHILTHSDYDRGEWKK